MINENIKIENIKALMEDTGCDEFQAKTALEIAHWNIEQAIINIGVMMKYITAYKAKINMKNENVYGLIHIITNNKTFELLRFSSVMTYNPAIYEQPCSMDWFAFEKTIYSYRLESGAIELYTKTIDKDLRDHIIAALRQRRLFSVEDIKMIFRDFFHDIETSVVAEELTLRDFKKLPNYFPENTHTDNDITADNVIDLDAIILEDLNGKKIENIEVGDNVLAKIVDTRDIAHYLGHLLGAIKDNEMIPMTVSVKNKIKGDGYYTIYLKYADLVCGVAKVSFGKTLKVLESKRLPWWKSIPSFFPAGK